MPLASLCDNLGQNSTGVLIFFFLFFLVFWATVPAFKSPFLTQLFCCCCLIKFIQVHALFVLITFVSSKSVSILISCWIQFGRDLVEGIGGIHRIPVRPIQTCHISNAQTDIVQEKNQWFYYLSSFFFCKCVM